MKEKRDRRAGGIQIVRFGTLLLQNRAPHAFGNLCRILGDESVTGRFDFACRAVGVGDLEQAHVVACRCQQLIHTVEHEFLQDVLLIHIAVAAEVDKLRFAQIVEECLFRCLVADFDSQRREATILEAPNATCARTHRHSDNGAGAIDVAHGRRVIRGGRVAILPDLPNVQRQCDGKRNFACKEPRQLVGLDHGVRRRGRAVHAVGFVVGALFFALLFELLGLLLCCARTVGGLREEKQRGCRH